MYFPTRIAGHPRNHKRRRRVDLACRGAGRKGVLQKTKRTKPNRIETGFYSLRSRFIIRRAFIHYVRVLSSPLLLLFYFFYIYESSKNIVVIVSHVLAKSILCYIQSLFTIIISINNSTHYSNILY